VKTAAAAPTLRLDGAEGARNSKPGAQNALSPKKARTYILVALVVMALAAVATMLWSQQQSRDTIKARAKQPASAPAAGGVKR
jgi:flagellar basal body-associated protein FliL